MQPIRVFGEATLAQAIVRELHGVCPALLGGIDDGLESAVSGVVFADRGLEGTPARAAGLAAVASAAVAGQLARAFSSEKELSRWSRALAGRLPRAKQPLRRVAILGESGAGKTVLASKLAPALGLPAISLDHELWWREDRERGWRAARRTVMLRAEEERWLAEGVYRGLVVAFARRADLAILLDFPSSLSRKQRESRGQGGALPLPSRVLAASLKAWYPLGTARFIRRDLSSMAHGAAVVRVRTVEEREAVTAAMIAAAHAAGHAPADASAPSA